MADELAKRVMRWMIGNDTGLSSKAIAAATLGELPVSPDRTPSDGSDFGRCYRLIVLIPETREGVRLLATHSAQWKRLDAIWEDLGELYCAYDYKSLYTRIQAALNPDNLRAYKFEKNTDGLWDIREWRADDKGGTHRLGPGLTVSFGE